MSVYKVSDNFFVAAQVTTEDMAAIAEMGFKSIICNRPDHEGSSQPTFSEIEAAALRAGIQARHVPVPPTPPTLDAAKDQAAAIAALEGPILAYCASGNRAANLWTMCENNNLFVSNQSAA